METNQLYMQLNAAELAAIIMKDSPNSNDRDAGFCSASSESEGGDDLTAERASMEAETVEPKPIPLLVRNKRKSTEPSKLVDAAITTNQSACCAATGPLKKRIRYISSADSAVVLTPRISASPPAYHCEPHEIMPNPAHIFVRHPGVTTFHRSLKKQHPIDEQQEPLALVAKKTLAPTEIGTINDPVIPKKTSYKKLSQSPTQEFDEEDICKIGSGSDISTSRPQQRNYKNMTRERRIEANARERTRVHTISAAYETLRHAVPAYASSQKLSKLSVLRVACSYILTLSRMAGQDYSADQSEPSIAECIDSVTSTIQTEGKVKRKKDD
ncbi:transcription factor Atoh8 [Drosophila tropicalis]|uniref:transcription factor Atoh8 n=1 Tax=Drosophila tropicalis TaxID=46794 RepID=UPI0035AB9044